MFLDIEETVMSPPNEPQAPDQSQQRHDVRGEPGDDRMRHGGGSPAVVVGTLGTLADCDATATPPASVGTIPSITEPSIAELNIAPFPQVADHAQRSCVLTAPEADNSPDLSAIPVSRERVPDIAPDTGIDAAAGETCPACMGSGRGHFGRCSICLGIGVL